MKKGTQEKLDAIQFNERKKRSIFIAAAITLLLIIGVATVPTDTKTVYGVTKGYTDKHTETGTSAVASVTLASGEAVLAEFPKNTPFVKNANVELTVQYSLLNYKTYRVVSYIK